MLDQYRQDHTGSLSDEQIKFYDREGYLVLADLLNDHDVTIDVGTHTVVEGTTSADVFPS